MQIPKFFVAPVRLSCARVLGSTLLAATLLSCQSAQTTACAQQAVQQNAGAITGTVLDPQGSDLQNAAVSLHADSFATRKTVSDKQGRFSFSDVPTGRYTVEITAPGFDTVSRKDVIVAAGGPPVDLAMPLPISSVADSVTVEAAASGSVAAALAPMDALLEERSARTEISSAFIQNFTSPLSDFSELVQQAPGTFSVNPNGVGLGDSKTYFRGFADGNYDITFDGIPFEDTNSPTHHSWAFFPEPVIGSIDFDRSPGSASTVGPTPFGGSINLLSREVPTDSNYRAGVSYGSFNTILLDFQADTGRLFNNRKLSLSLDFNRLTSDGYETFNFQQRNSGALKAQYKFSDKTILTGFSNVEIIDSNTPNLKGPTRAQVAQFGNSYLLQNTDPTAVNYFAYNFYHIPTDFEYVGFKTELAHNIHLENKGYTYSYYNQQNYPLAPTANKNPLPITPANCLKAGVVQNCGTDKLNSYRRYGDIFSASQVSRFGVARAGLWYEYAATDRHQVPQNPFTLADNPLPNFNEQFATNTYQPFVEYEAHPLRKLTVTGGIKFAVYTFNILQHTDNGGAIGTLPNGLGGVEHTALFHSYLPSLDVNYRIKQNWSVYAQYGTGSVIPPSSVYDVSNVLTPKGGQPTLIANPVSVLPVPSYARTYQGGSVLKLKRVTLDGDFYYVRYGNAYTASPDPNAAGASEFQSSGDTATQGFEGEANVYIVHGLSVYGSGTVGSARYVSPTIAQGTLTYLNPNNNAWVANTPGNTEGIGVTYQHKNMDFGFFDKRIGAFWQDNKTAAVYNYTNGTTATSSITANQAIFVDSFNVGNVFLNYTLRNGSHFDQTKFRLSLNNVFNSQNIVGVTGTSGTSLTNPYTLSQNDNLTITPPRSINLTVTFGYAPKR